ncbi:hypothetical protein [Adlercreutzia equolifaciens]|uniref:hypothetical protein n=1 Tax=Adlercreutzia equolifaciens TaxID=446660 RepID=UPI003C6C0847
MKLIVEPVANYTLPDYGGAMIYNNYNATRGNGQSTSNVTVMGGHGNYFSPLDPRSANTSQNTTFTLFKISWIPIDAALPEGAAEPTGGRYRTQRADGTRGGSIVDASLQYDRPVDTVMPDSTRMEVGDRIELYFDVYASVDDLPQVYQRHGVTGDRLQAGDGTMGLEPAYFPRVGEYYYADYTTYSDNWTGRINPLNGAQGLHDTWGAFAVRTDNILMDMDYLMLDAAFSGDKPEQTDTWEMFDGSYSYIPGEATSYGHYGSGWDVNNWGVNGMGCYAYPYSTDGNSINYHSNINSSAGSDATSIGYFLDTDMKTSNYKQPIRYTPRPKAGTKNSVETQLPDDTHYVWWYDGDDSANTGGGNRAAENNYANGAPSLTNRHRYVRDWYAYVVKPRVNATPDNGRWQSSTPLVWSETRLHLRKAWLAASSRFISAATATDGSGVSNYEAQRFYNGLNGAEDAHAGWTVGGYDYSGQHYRDHRGVIRGQYATALEYNQDFISELVAYNYGDRNLDGVEFTYVMPRGVEPKVGGTIEAPDDDDDLDADAVDYYGKVVMQVNADGLTDPIIVDVVGVTGNVVLQDFALTPNEPVVLGGVTPATEEGGDDVPYTFPEGDYWIVIKEVGTTEEGLPFATGEYTYNVLVTGEDGKQTVERRTTPYKPLSFHVTAHEGMVAANPSETTGADGATVSTGISASVDDALLPEKKKVFAEDDGTGAGTLVPVKLTRYTGEVINGQTPDGAEVITVNRKNYVRDANGKYVACSEVNHFVEIDVYDPSVPSQVNAELALDRVEHDSTITVQVNAEGASADAPATVQIVAMTPRKVQHEETVQKTDDEGKPVVGEDGQPVMETITVTETVYDEGAPVDGFEAVAVAANEPVEIATLPRGHYGVKITASPQMPSELGGGLSYVYPTEAVHFYVVGLGEAIEVPAWNLEHKWDDSTLSLTVSAYGADTPAQVVIRNENGDIVDPITGRVVLPGEDGEPVDDAPYRIAVAKDAKTDLAVLPKGTYYVSMVEAPTMDFDYTVMEAEVVDGVPTGDEIEVAKKGTWPFVGPATAVEVEADGHGTALDITMECTLADAPAVTDGESVVRINVAAPGAPANAVFKYSLMKVVTTGEGAGATESEEEIEQRADVIANRPVFLKSLSPGTYRLRLVESPKLADGTTFALPERPIDFVVEDGGACVDLDVDVEVGTNAGQVTVKTPADSLTFPVGGTFTFRIVDALGEPVQIVGDDGQPADRRTVSAEGETVIGMLPAGGYKLIVESQSWDAAPYLHDTAFTVDGTGGLTTLMVTANSTAPVAELTAASVLSTFATALFCDVEETMEEGLGVAMNLVAEEEEEAVAPAAAAPTSVTGAADILASAIGATNAASDAVQPSDLFPGTTATTSFGLRTYAAPTSLSLEATTDGAAPSAAAFYAAGEEGADPSDGGINTNDLADLSRRIKAQVYLLKTTTGVGGNYSQDPYASSQWVEITDLMELEVVQTPTSAPAGYYAPSSVQDPYLANTGNPAAGIVQTTDASKSTYTAVRAEGATNQSISYRDSSQPWVLKIKVKQDLAKWFGRSIDMKGTDAADPDFIRTWSEYNQYAETLKAILNGNLGGYQIKVNIPSHVFGNNENERWYDRVLTRPWDDPTKKVGQNKAAGEEPSRSSAYYQVYDYDHFEGLSRDRTNNLQPYGMDYKYTMQRYWRHGSEMQLAGAPNMPAVNGWTVQNNTVRTTTPVDTSTVADPMGMAVANLDFWKKAYKDEGSTGPVLYAQTGTQAVMRKPVVRVWNSISLPDVLAGDQETGTVTDAVGSTSANYYMEAETDTRQVNVHVENRFWWDSLCRNYSYVSGSDTGWSINENRTHTYSVEGGQMGALVLPVVTVVLPFGITPLHRETRKPYGQWPGRTQEFLYEDWDIAQSTNANWNNQGQVNQNEPLEWLKDNFAATVTYEKVEADATQYPADDINDDNYRFVVRFIPKGDDLNHDPATEQRILSHQMDTFKFSIAMTEEPEWEELPAHKEAARTTESIRTYVTSAMTGYKGLVDNDIPGNPYTVGAPSQFRASGDSIGRDARLDALSASYFTRWGDVGDYNTNSGNRRYNTTNALGTALYTDAHGWDAYRYQWEYDNVFNGSYTYQHNCYMSGGSWVHRSHWWNNVQMVYRLPYNFYNAGTQTNDQVQYNHLTGYFGTYTEKDGSQRPGGPRVGLTGNAGNEGLNISEYNFRTQYGLSKATTNNLNNNYLASDGSLTGDSTNSGATRTEAFATRKDGKQAEHIDRGAFAASKIRLKTPTLGSTYKIENTPTTRPTDKTTLTDAEKAIAGGDLSATASLPLPGAADGALLASNQAKSKEGTFEYDDEMWFSATFSNSVIANKNASGQQGKEGALQHAKLVFSVYLPEQVTFYDQKKLMNLGEVVTPADFEKLFCDYEGDDYEGDDYEGDDYEGDDYAFYVEHTYRDRHSDAGTVKDPVTGSAVYPKREKQQKKYERLTPKQLIEQGWTVRVRVQPDYDKDAYGALASGAANKHSEYGKPDGDDPNDTVDAADVKGRARSGETIVFELTPPDDANDAEFLKHASLLSAFWDNVRADGYLGAGDAVTLKVRTRIDNVGDEESALADLTDENGELLPYNQQKELVRKWSTEATKAYFTAEDRDVAWLPKETGWSHRWTGETATVTVSKDEKLYKAVTDGAGNVLYGADGFPQYTALTDPAGADEQTVTLEQGALYLRPTVEEDSTGVYGVGGFNNQCPEYFQWADEASLVYDSDTREDPDTLDIIPAVDYDKDGVYTSGDKKTGKKDVRATLPERHMSSTSGMFTIRKPSASVRVDTGMVRIPTNDTSSTDSTQSGNNNLWVTQAVNTGAAVNSFIVDWQVPLWALGSQSNENAPWGDPTVPVGKVTPDIEYVKSGVWEIPGTYEFELTNPVTGEVTKTSEGDHYFTDDGTEIGAWRIDFQRAYSREVTINGTASSRTVWPYYGNDDNDYVPREGDELIKNEEYDQKKDQCNFVFKASTVRVPVNTPEAAANRAIEDKLWVLVYVRRAHTNVKLANSGYVEQNGNDPVPNTRENFSMPGTDADRDYFFGEDDAADCNTAGSANTYKWELVGWTKVSAKQNMTFSQGVAQAGTQIRQVRWVVRACNTDASGKPIIDDETLSHEVPVPSGFRLATDADPDTAAAEEPDAIDPLRNNTAWRKQKDYNDQIVYKYVDRNLGNVNELADENGLLSKVYKIGPNKLYYFGEIITTKSGAGGRTLSAAEMDAALKGTAPNPAVEGEECWDRTMQGDLIVQALESQWVVGTSLPSTVTANAAGVLGHAFISELPKLQTNLPLAGVRTLGEPEAGQKLRVVSDGQSASAAVAAVTDALTSAGVAVQAADETQNPDEDPNLVKSDSVHVNHFATVVPRYDDTKYAQFERDRAGFFRSDEKPTIKIDAKQWYFSGTNNNGYGWNSESIMLDPEDSLFLRYEVTLYNMSEGQLRLLGFDPEEEGTPYSVDTCTNPSVSTLLPRIQNYGPTPESMFNTLPDLTSAQKKRLQQADAVRAIGKKLQEITDETDRATFEASLRSIAAELEGLCGRALTETNPEIAASILHGDDVPDSSRADVETTINSLRSQVKVLLGYHPRVVHEDGTETPEGYDIADVEPSDARVAGKNVFAQGNALQKRVEKERPYSRVFQYVPASDLVATASSDGQLDWSGNRMANDGFDYKNDSMQSTQRAVKEGDYLSPLAEGYRRKPTSTTAGDASHMNSQVPLWTYRVVKYKQYERDDFGYLWTRNDDGTWNFIGTMDDEGNVSKNLPEGTEEPVKPEGTTKPYTSLTDFDELTPGTSTAAIRPEEGMTRLGAGVLANGGTEISAKDEFAYLYGVQDDGSEADTGVSDNLTANTRRSFTWNFLGQNGSRGVLNPGEAIILDFMMQFSPQSSASTDVGNALILSSYADKAGSYDFYDYPLFRTETINDEKVTKIVTKATINDPESSVIKDSSYRSDLNDGNGNGDRSETLLRKDTNSIGWSNND